MQRISTLLAWFAPFDRDKSVAHKLQTDGRHDRGYAREIKGTCDNCPVQNLDHLPGEIAWLAFALAVVFGAVANRANFCTMGAITDVVLVGDWRRMRMWLLAIAVAIAGAAFLESTATVDFSKTIYTTAKVPWLSHIVGGLLFGFGMTLASGCGSKSLIRTGAGNLKSLVVLIVLGVSAYMTLKGLFAVLRVNALDTFRFDTATLGAARSDLQRRGALVGGVLGQAWFAASDRGVFAIWALGSRLRPAAK